MVFIVLCSVFLLFVCMVWLIGISCCLVWKLCFSCIRLLCGLVWNVFIRFISIELVVIEVS